MPPSESDRQTHTRVVHPHRGPGLARYDNGPSAFVPDDGEPVPMPISNGGASSKPARSWLVARDPDHGRVEMDIVEHGERHLREWSPVLGLGWLVHEKEIGAVRFEGDDGRTTRMRWTTMSSGTPEHVAKAARARTRYPKEGPDDRNWTTLALDNGGVMAFRHNGPPPDAAAKAGT